ncbi:DUF4864 domain-containing protein [Roseobacteraceae bacterium S113]
MLRVLLTFVLLSWGALMSAQEDMGRVTAIEDTITAQINAFKADDFETAFSFAAPNIQGIFGNSERFGMMVRQGYPMVWRPEDVRYLELRKIAGALWQRVQVTDARGEVHFLDYRMVEADNGWKISGVQILKPPAANV